MAAGLVCLQGLPFTMLIVRGVCVHRTAALRAAWLDSPIPEREWHGSGGTLEPPQANRQCESEI